MVENNCLREELCVMERYRSAAFERGVQNFSFPTLFDSYRELLLHLLHLVIPYFFNLLRQRSCPPHASSSRPDSCNRSDGCVTSTV